MLLRRYHEEKETKKLKEEPKKKLKKEPRKSKEVKD